MSLFRDLTNAVREQWKTAVAEAQGQAQNRAPIRPTSLREAGATGASDVDRARMRQDRARDQEARTERNNRYPEGAAPNDQAQRTRRRPPVEASSRIPRGDQGAVLLASLRSPASLRTAILIREVLDPPVALRGDGSPGSGDGNPGTSNS
ncbi:MAG: hypothetical protein M3457_15155 [Chloroflexota bacterium]|nr:hypothetical protein [Chloroflexota bacterium]